MRQSAPHQGERRAAVRATARRPSRVRGERRHHARADRDARPRLARRRGIVALVSLAAVAGMLATVALAPLPRPSIALAGTGSTSLSPFHGDVQEYAVPGDLAAAGVSRESYAAATGPDTLVASGTNYDWAKLVLVFGDWPVTDENVRFMVEWMREENGPDNWWNRNNPLNNGYGSGGGSGLGSYASLVDAARYAASNLHKRTFYADIVASLEAGTSADATARAVWASPWAESHYGFGTWWSTSRVPVVPAPASAWGR
jgi:hypothetical protein